MQPPPFLQEHLADMRLRGLAEGTTVYARLRAVSRLAAWLACYGEDAHGPLSSGPGSAGNPVLENLPDVRADAGPGLPDASAADLLAWRRSLTVSPRSVAPYVDHIRGYYAWLVKTGYRPDNPAENLPVPRGHRGLPRPISEPDLERALTTAPRRVRPWLVLAAGAGLRAKEIALLRRENVHDEAAQPWLLVAGDATKGNHERIIDLSDWVVREVGPVLPSRGWVFPRYDGALGPNRPGLVTRLANEHLHRSGTTATLHQLRHRCLSLAYQESLDIRYVQELAGHASPQTTAGYAAIRPGKGAAVMNALPVPGRLRLVSGDA